VYILVSFEIDKAADIPVACETFKRFVLVLPNARFDRSTHTDVKQFRRIRNDVHVITMFSHSSNIKSIVLRRALVALRASGACSG
jgi:hypothetical protein